MKKVVFLMLFALFVNAGVLVEKGENNEIYALSLAQNSVDINNMVLKLDEDKELAKDIYIYAVTPKNELNVILVKNPDFTALIDTGFDYTSNTLIEELQKLGLEPENITHIILTHSHIDHIGALDLFKNAKILVSSSEVDFWKKNMDINNLNITTFEPNEELIKKGSQIFALSAFGHTPGHSLIAFSKAENNNKEDIVKNSTFIFVADIFHFYDLQKISPMVTAVFDDDKAKAIRARTNIMERLKKFKIPFLGSHMPSQEPIILNADDSEENLDLAL